jgi:hypothetical protein
MIAHQTSRQQAFAHWLTAHVTQSFSIMTHRDTL